MDDLMQNMDGDGSNDEENEEEEEAFRK